MEIRVDININDVRELARKYPEIFVDEVSAVMDEVTAKIEADVIQLAPAGVGGAAGLRGSIYGETVVMGEQIVGKVAHSSLYGDIVEMGRRPGKFPPTAPIALWVRSILGVSGAEAKAVTFLVARKIARKGYKGAWMFKRALEKDQSWAMEKLSGVAKRIADRANKG